MEPCYTLRIDGPLLGSQRRVLARLIEAASDKKPYVCENDDRSLLERILALLDELADQAHDRCGMDCLEPNLRCRPYRVTGKVTDRAIKKRPRKRQTGGASS